MTNFTPSACDGTDLGIMGHTHTIWLSDVVAPIPSAQLAYGCTLAFAPEVCNHWMVGDRGNSGEVDVAASPGWWDFMFRIPMNGQYGVSSRVFDWTPELRQRAAENITLYKRIRNVIMGADVYHLTPSPANQDPEGWMGLQYVSPDRRRSVLMAYRLGRGPGDHRFRLRGLDPSAWYKIRIDGVSERGLVSQQELSTLGLPVKLDAEWRAAVIEIEVSK